MSHKVGIVTYDARALPATYKPDDYLLKEALTRRGAKATIISWTNPQVEPTRFDALVLRSCWDVHHNRAAYMSWLERVEADRSRLINPYPVVLWNYHKEQYLTDLTIALRNHPSPQGQITPSVFYTRQASALKKGSLFQPAGEKSLADILAELDTQAASPWRGRDIIIKPTVSAEGENTLRIVRSPANQDIKTADVLSMNEAEAWLEILLQDDRWPGIIIQPFIAGIKNGEYSLIYIAGKYSHAVHKIVDLQDFKNRLETRRAGIRTETLPSGMLAFADQVMELVQTRFPSKTIVYARIDLVQDADGGPILLECELGAPNLQFVRLPEIYYSKRQAPSEAEIKQGEIALDAALDRFTEAIIAQTDRMKAQGKLNVPGG